MHRLRVDGEHFVPTLRSDVFQRINEADCHAVYEDIESSEAACHVVNQFDARLRVGDVDALGRAASTEFASLAGTMRGIGI